MKDVLPGDSVHSLLSILDIITVSSLSHLLLSHGMTTSSLTLLSGHSLSPCLSFLLLLSLSISLLPLSSLTLFSAHSLSLSLSFSLFSHCPLSPFALPILSLSLFPSYSLFSLLTDLFLPNASILSCLLISLPLSLSPSSCPPLLFLYPPLSVSPLIHLSSHPPLSILPQLFLFYPSSCPPTSTTVQPSFHPPFKITFKAFLRGLSLTKDILNQLIVKLFC